MTFFDTVSGVVGVSGSASGSCDPVYIVVLVAAVVLLILVFDFILGFFRRLMGGL